MNDTDPGPGPGSGPLTDPGLGPGPGGAARSAPVPRPGFRLLDVALHTEEWGRLTVALEGGPDDEPLVLGEGTRVSVGLTFRSDQAVDGLTYEERRTRGGRGPATTRTLLGGFRGGGPYEVWLPPRRMPEGRAHCGLYRITGRLTDGHGRELARVDHHVRLVHLSGAPERHPPVGA
ncbi:hypothetical protein [Streptomyces hydrogenans]|uniref:hypothetical protein n=1 Tax=Streptomyces hydrogenans TaxID=1873719 RepID=UPI003828DABF